jgi:hypothetical protein
MKVVYDFMWNLKIYRIQLNQNLTKLNIMKYM